MLVVFGLFFSKKNPSFSGFSTYFAAGGALLLLLEALISLWVVPLVARGRSCNTFDGTSFITFD